MVIKDAVVSTAAPVAPTVAAEDIIPPPTPPSNAPCNPPKTTALIKR
jgi:hypothetical protein